MDFERLTEKTRSFLQAALWRSAAATNNWLPNIC